MMVPWTHIHVSDTDPSSFGSGSFCSDPDPLKSGGSSHSNRLRVVAKSAGSENADFTSMDALRLIFKRENRVLEP
jgi:hypothetical protein